MTFSTTDPAGAPVYHTNVMMAVGTDVAVVCAEAVEDAAERAHLLQRLGRHHKARCSLARGGFIAAGRWRRVGMRGVFSSPVADQAFEQTLKG